MPRSVTNGLALKGQRIRDVGSPSSGTDAATKDYVDATARGLDWKPSVRAASTGNLDLASMPSSVDGVALANGDRFLAKDQATASDRGIYVFNGAAAAATRAQDADSDAEVTAGLAVSVTEGTVNGDTTWVLTTNDPIVLGTTALAFSQLGGTTSPPTAGNGLTLDSGAYNVGQGTGITVSADAVAINTAVVVRKYAAAIGDGAATVIDVPHSLGTYDVTYDVFLNSGARASELPDAERPDVNTLRLTFATAPANGEYRVVVHG